MKNKIEFRLITMKHVIIYSFPIFLFSNCNFENKKIPPVPNDIKGTYSDNSIYIKKERKNSNLFLAGIVNADTLTIEVEKKYKLGKGDGFSIDDEVYIFPKVTINGTIIYTEESREAFRFEKDDIKFISNGAEKLFYLLIKKIDPIEGNKFLVFQINDKQIKHKQEVIDDYLQDVDEDNKLEVGGFNIVEAYCHECDSVYYNPARLYELDEVFKFDTVASTKITKEKTGFFYGFNGNNKIIIPKRNE